MILLGDSCLFCIFGEAYDLWVDDLKPNIVFSQMGKPQIGAIDLS